ncbi:hypothetical protein RFI_29808 [Reticulomyxa filosa]|uniref:Uncharacterized protein n=1 Tax=Reticulomyxa filosa TaxID=46433 RepID=X6M134_RETFI|nr:hypothetical protein RFI_29808 [Reticulomyxa filosa]|eukprot:ETO07584.1 hypothetical protein RFI_29808 [Reticulomyxa filosa]
MTLTEFKLRNDIINKQIKSKISISIFYMNKEKEGTKEEEKDESKHWMKQTMDFSQNKNSIDNGVKEKMIICHYGNIDHQYEHNNSRLERWIRLMQLIANQKANVLLYIHVRSPNKAIEKDFEIRLCFFFGLNENHTGKSEDMDEVAIITTISPNECVVTVSEPNEECFVKKITTKGDIWKMTN